MYRLLRLASIVSLLCLPLKVRAQYQVIELSDVQLAKTLSAVVQDPTDSPLSNVLVQEFDPKWKTVLRTSATDKTGRFSLAPVQGRRVYCLQLSTPGFDPLRVRVQVDSKRGTNLKLRLEIAT
jgi:carboxypeptidase family protein